MPGITPHRAGLPGSVWDLTYVAWLKLVATARAYREDQKEGQRRRG